MKKVKGFTLIELLIVMGVLVILIGISVIMARSAIKRSNEIFHMEAAEGLSEALIKFRSDNKYIPLKGNCSTCFSDEFFAYALGDKGEGGVLEQYIEEEFDGGSDATYYYGTDDIGQFFVVCVSLGGIDDENHFGYYCTGNGIGFVPESDPITKNNIESDDTQQIGVLSSLDDSDWKKDEGFAN